MNIVKETENFQNRFFLVSRNDGKNTASSDKELCTILH